MIHAATGEIKTCWLGLGANLGERERNLRLALEQLAQTEGIELHDVSSFYQTAPWGVENQPDYINAAACVRTALEPMGLLRAVHAVEERLGRLRKEHWGARTIDIDLLHIEGVSCDRPELSLPHPLLFRRAFVLVPLAEIADSLVIEGKTVHSHLAACTDRGSVARRPGSPADFGLCLLACVDRNGGLGRDGRLLFRFPEDLRRFRARTLGKTVILGRRTLATFPEGRPLSGRCNLVLSTRMAEIPGAVAVPCLEDLWRCLQDAPSPAFVIGGEIVYRELLPYCREALVTHVDADGGADCFLPRLEGRGGFLRISSQSARDRETGIAMEFCRYRRARGQWKQEEDSE